MIKLKAAIGILTAFVLLQCLKIKNFFLLLMSLSMHICRHLFFCTFAVNGCVHYPLNSPPAQT